VRRDGFTLLEVVVALAIGALVFAAAWAVWRLSDHSRGVSAHLRSLETALLAEAQITEDLGRLVAVRGSLVGVDAAHADTLSLYALDPAYPKVAPPGVRAVFYDRDPATGYLRRASSGAVSSVGVSPLTSLSFSPFQGPTGPLLRVTLFSGRDPGDPAAARPLVYSFLARIPCGPNLPALSFEILHDFVDPKQAPDTALPAL